MGRGTGRLAVVALPTPADRWDDRLCRRIGRIGPEPPHRLPQLRQVLRGGPAVQGYAVPLRQPALLQEWGPIIQSMLKRAHPSCGAPTGLTVNKAPTWSHESTMEADRADAACLFAMGRLGKHRSRLCHRSAVSVPPDIIERMFQTHLMPQYYQTTACRFRLTS